MKKEALKKLTKKEIKEAYALDYFFSQNTNDYEDLLSEDERMDIATTLRDYDIDTLSEEEIDRLFYFCSLDPKDPEYKGYKIFL